MNVHTKILDPRF